VNPDSNAESPTRRGWHTDAAVWSTWVVGVTVSLALSPAGDSPAIKTILLTGLLWPAVEELAFRGVAQSALARYRFGRASMLGVSGANVGASILFAASHLFEHPPLHAALVFFPSLVFGYFRDRHDGLAVPVLLHVSFNLAWLLAPNVV
jgi:membrane protease YdiL (CAAX protease family)